MYVDNELKNLLTNFFNDVKGEKKEKALTDFLTGFYNVLGERISAPSEENKSTTHKVNVDGEIWEAICDDPDCACHEYVCNCDRNDCEYKYTVKEIHENKYRQEDYVWSPPYRWMEFRSFSDEVLGHIETYTVPQYGDYPDDQLTETSNECIIHDMKRYLNRFNTGQRGYKETMRDMLKIAHYAGVIYNRLQKDIEIKATDGKCYCDGNVCSGGC